MTVLAAPSPWSFEWEPLFLVLVLLAAFAYARAARPYRPSRARIAVFALGLALVVAALCTPLETIARHYLVLFHLLGNVMIADWAPPLLILGLTPAMRSFRSFDARGSPCQCGLPFGTSSICRGSTTMHSDTSGCSTSSTRC